MAPWGRRRYTIVIGRLGKAIAEIVPEAAWQRCYVHFLRNALDYLPRKADDDCLRELRRRTRVVRISPMRRAASG